MAGPGNPRHDDALSGNVTRLIGEAGRGSSQAADELLAVVYGELRRLASARLAREKPQTLQATALVHEAYLRLIGNKNPSWQHRGHFFGAAAEAMRRILVEQARRRQAAKHGGGRQRVELDESIIAPDDESTDLIALGEALDRLEKEDPHRAELVKLRYFIGM
ncbi:MAG: RNA polymerase subunit sigma, partial [Planctomycetes bacterium]|nr:RNA polymerase subunit sigma [Planctomycetota bacterium]